MPQAKKKSSNSRQKSNKSKKAMQLQNTQNKMRPKERMFKGAQGTGLSACAQNYAKALVNPFGTFDELPCVPCAPADLTQRVRALYRGNFTTGTAGVGFIVWAPLKACNDQGGIFSTTASFAGTTYALTPTVGVTSSNKTTLPFPNSAFANPGTFMQARLVGAGLRVRNTTAPLYKSGAYTASRIATGQGLQLLPDALRNNALDTVKQACSLDDWVYWNWVPQDEEDYDFPDANIDYTGNSGKSAPNFGILVTGAQISQPSTFEWEIVEFWEFQGQAGSFQATSLLRSHADPVGQARVLEGVAVPPKSMQQKDLIRQVSESVVEAMAHSDTVSKTVEDLLGMAGMALPAVSRIVSSMISMLSV
jgi:hypothetical protein